MIRKAETLAMTVLLVAMYCSLALGQATPTILEIETENEVNYQYNVADFARFATDPNRATVANPTFATWVTLGDIVTVNGRPAKGTFVNREVRINLAISPSPGQGISDTSRGGFSDSSFEILHPDGTPIGSIMVSGLRGGSGPPGAALGTTANQVIPGGTGAFFGVRGQAVVRQIVQSIPFVSVTEDPANRRMHGGGKRRIVLHVIPMSVPQIVATPGGPAVTHSSDFALVTASRPAAAGEFLSLFMTGLGPTRPGVDPGKPFPANPTVDVNSPVEVTVNGRPAQVQGASGFPGAVDGYQVNFRVPPDTARGTATIQVSAAWIAGPEVRITVQ